MVVDPSDNACIEILRPKSVPEGLLALGTVVQVVDTHIKIQITGGINCIVEKDNISSSYSDVLAHSQQPPKLSDLFKKGEQYVCKIVEKRSRRGYADAQDIIATLDPSSIQEDSLPKSLLSIPYVPLQCAVQAVEEHGYLMDLGFKSLTGFLNFEESRGQLIVGQIVRCCSFGAVTDKDERVVPLSMTKESMKKSEFSREKVTQNLLTEKCILPGCRSFLTVMKVLNNGLIVNFMNEFAGFVGTNHLKDEWHTPKNNYKVSDQLKCTVLYYNNITKMFALSLVSKKKRKKTLKHFMENYHTGEFVKKAKVAYLEGSKAVYFKLSNTFKGVANVRDSLEKDVETMTRDELLTELDSSFPEGTTHRCRIKSVNLADLIVVLSLRQSFLDLPYVSVEELKPADFIEVTIKKYVKVGIVVTFGLNLRAIILNQDLHDYISASSYKRYPVGKKIKCRVLKLDFSKQPPKVYLTNKEPLMEADLIVVDKYDKSLKGKTTAATIVKVSDKGLIVELFNNIKGFMPLRFLSPTTIKKVGEVTSCVIYRVDPPIKSLQLGTIPYEKIIRMKKEKKVKDQMKKLIKIDAKLGKKVSKQKLKRKRSESAASSDEDLHENENVQPVVKKQLKEKSESSDEERVEVESEQVVEKGSFRQRRSEEARLREEELREAERDLTDPNRQPQSIMDFERYVLKSPNSAESWIRYSNFFLDNVETEKARIVCRRALKTINFRMEKEKLRIWLHLIKIDAKFGGHEKLNETLEEAAQTNDRLSLYQGAAKVLVNCNELDEAERLHELMLKKNKTPNVWDGYIQFCMEHRKDLERARAMYEKASKNLPKSDQIFLTSRFGQLEFRFGEVERGKTVFEKLLSNNPKRVDLWRIYEAMIRKFGARQSDSEEIKEQNEQILLKIAENAELVSRKGKKKLK